MFLNRLERKEKNKFMDLAFYMASVDGPSPTEEATLIQMMKAELGEAGHDYKFNGSPKLEDLDATVTYFKDKNYKVKKIVFLNLLKISFIDDIYNTEEHFFLENIQKEFGIDLNDRKKLLQIVYAERDVLEAGRRIISE